MTSALLFPLPQLGAVASFFVQPFRGEVFRWRIGLEPALDCVLFLPVFSNALNSELRWTVGAAHFGLKLGGGYTLGLTSGFGVAASAKLFAGVGF